MKPALKKAAIGIVIFVALAATTVDWRFYSIPMGQAIHDAMFPKPINATGCKEGSRHKPKEVVDPCTVVILN